MAARRRPGKAAPPARVVHLPGEPPREVEDDVGRVQVVEGVGLVCAVGYVARSGLVDPQELPALVAFFPILDLLPGEERPEPGQGVYGHPVFAFVPPQEAAKIAGLTTRQLLDLERKGLPVVGARKEKRYPIPHLSLWLASYRRRGGPEGRVPRLPWRIVRADWESYWARVRVELAEADL